MPSSIILLTRTLVFSWFILIFVFLFKKSIDTLSATKLDKLAEKIAEVAGADDCGCDKRREKLNRMFPYNGVKKWVGV